MAVRELMQSDGSSASALGESRSRVLTVLQDAGKPLAVSDVAHRVGLHANTARFHLDALVQAGQAERATEERVHRGRPRVLYAARPETGRGGQRSYRLLAEILTSYVAAETPQPTQAARKAGEAWGRYLADRPPPFQQVDTETATEHLIGTLDAIGFAPEAVTAGDERQILLHRCPFREVAEVHRDVVCSIHLGLMRGLLAAFDAPVDAERLDPFVKPDLCVTHLRTKTPAKIKRRRRS
ncbi:MAG: helix-turn-helix transcriptional regulator [Actinoallomurus sp.]